MSYYEIEAEDEGYFYFSKRHAVYTPPHFHSGCELCFVEKGTARVYVGATEYLLTPGKACFIDGFSVHSYEEIPDTSLYIVLGDKKYFSEVLSFYGKKTPPVCFDFNDFTLLNDLYALFLQSESDPETLSAFSLGAVGILFSAISKSTAFTENKQDRTSYIICDILKYARDNLAEDLSLGGLSRHFGYSKEYLSRIIHCRIREDWNDYVNGLRIRKAAEMLKKQDRNVLDVAMECGFGSANTFYRTYKKEYGVRPRRTPKTKDVNK